MSGINVYPIYVGQKTGARRQVTSTSVNGGIHAEPKVGNRDRERTRVGSAESERESLLTQENTPKQMQMKHKQLYTCINEQQQPQQQHSCSGGAIPSGSGAAAGGGVGGAACGCESDTNSNCALLVEDPNTASLLSSATGTTKTINGNNNYELCEFDAKVPTYRNVSRITNQPVLPGGHISQRTNQPQALTATKPTHTITQTTCCTGCADRIVSWLRHTADILFVLGYCVIAFLKLCFLGILRYEIKEMIQKIKLLQTEMSGAILNGVDCDQQQIQQVREARKNVSLSFIPSSPQAIR
ncbi:hypothetical protein ZHAS_00002017 [Anopheles sinensis]|uniref:Uncharacterized protein n=1 Tax=Anopheles sinensis TaxID=74873 RepID=A0A084VBP7_ANOSI|nr:hypothetical protein ZHAS_00002017 [Anopheles sinensis]